MSLTVKSVATLKRRGQPGRHLDERNLYLVIKSPANAHWELRYQTHNVKRYHGLGSAFDFSLVEARERARKARQALTDGIDPVLAKRAERAQRTAEAARNKTFAIVAREYLDAHGDGWSKGHLNDSVQKLRNHINPLIGHIPVKDIDQPLVLSVVQPLWKTKVVTAQRLRQKIEAVLNFASSAEYRSGPNPARWRGHLEFRLAKPERLTKVENHPALPYAETPAFMKELRAVPGTASLALQFLILTGTRRDETRLATWDEINLLSKRWVVPASRMKNRKEFAVPLSAQAITLLKSLPRDGSRFLFPGVKPNAAIGQHAMLRVLKSLRPDTDADVHGFRSSFRTWAEERTNFQREVKEEALAHQVAGAVERPYRRTTRFPERARLMTMWADYLDSTPIESAGDVVPFAGRH